MPVTTSYKVDNDKRFQAQVNRAIKAVGDITLPLNLIAKDFYKSEQAIFKLKSAGRYDDLRERTKKQKMKQVGFVYPILKRTGRLEGSVTNPTHPDSINVIINKKLLMIGTKVEYGAYHQSDDARSVIPLRKFLFIGPEAGKFADKEQKGRPQRWQGILEGYVLKKSKQLGRTTK